MEKEKKKQVKKASKVNKKEIIITVVVLLGAVAIGVTLGKILFDAFNAR